MTGGAVELVRGSEVELTTPIDRVVGIGREVGFGDDDHLRGDFVVPQQLLERLLPVSI